MAQDNATRWKVGDRVIVTLPDNHGDYGPRGRYHDFIGTAVGIDDCPGRRGVTVKFDQIVNGLWDCYATPDELRRAAS